MDPAQREVLDLIRDRGGVLVRTTKHIVYRFPNGQIFSLAKTPSDHRGWLNTLSDLRRALQIQRTFRPDWGVRREKVVKKKDDNGSQEINVELPSAGIHTPTIQEKVGVALGTRLPHQELMEVLKKIPDRPKYEPPRIHKTPRPRHGEVKTIPPEVLNESRYLSKLWGAEAGEKYLQDYMDEHWYGEKKKVNVEKTEEENKMGNPADVLGAMVTNARTNLQNLQQSIKAHQEALQREEAQVKEIQNFLSGLEMVAEQAKAAAPALRSLLPETRSFTRLKTARTPRGKYRHLGAGGVFDKDGLEALKFAQSLFGTAHFSVAQLWHKVDENPDLHIKRTSLYGTLASAAQDRANRPAILEKVSAGVYHFLPNINLDTIYRAPEEENQLPMPATA